MSQNATPAGPHQPAEPATYAVADCGGTHTRLEIWRGEEMVAQQLFGSANTASRSAQEARSVYAQVVTHLVAHLDGHADSGMEAVVATAAFDDASADSWPTFSITWRPNTDSAGGSTWSMT